MAKRKAQVERFPSPIHGKLLALTLPQLLPPT
jgi:hypothetical protein